MKLLSWQTKQIHQDLGDKCVLRKQAALFHFSTDWGLTKAKISQAEQPEWASDLYCWDIRSTQEPFYEDLELISSGISSFCLSSEVSSKPMV